MASVSKYSDKERAWKPFVPTDLQFEYVIMKPYIRRTFSLLDSNVSQTLPLSLQRHIASIPGTEAILYANSVIPDRTGISTLRLFYLRKGYCSIDESMPLIIRHFAHNEYPTKFVLGYPYYTSMLSCLFAIVLISFFFLLHKRSEKKESKAEADEGTADSKKAKTS